MLKQWAVAVMAVVIASDGAAFVLQRSCSLQGPPSVRHLRHLRLTSARGVQRAQPMRQPGRDLSMAAEGRKKGAKGSRGRVLRIALEEMYEGVELQGIIRSIRPFGAFVDVGSTTDGLLHISNMLPAHRQYFGNELVVTASEGEQVLVEVTEVNLKTRKFNLREVEETVSAPRTHAVSGDAAGAKSQRAIAPDLEKLYDAVLTGDEDVEEEERKLRARHKEGAALEKWTKKMRNKGATRQVTHAIVKQSTEYGAFVEMGGREGLLHVSEMTGAAVSRGGKVLLKNGDKVQVRVLAVDVAEMKITWSMKPWEPTPDEEAAELRREATASGGSGAKTAGGGSGSSASGAGVGFGGSAGQVKAGGGASASASAAGVDDADVGSGKNAFAVAWEKALKDASD